MPLTEKESDKSKTKARKTVKRKRVSKKKQAITGKSVDTSTGLTFVPPPPAPNVEVDTTDQAVDKPLKPKRKPRKKTVKAIIEPTVDGEVKKKPRRTTRRKAAKKKIAAEDDVAESPDAKTPPPESGDTTNDGEQAIEETPSSRRNRKPVSRDAREKRSTVDVEKEAPREIREEDQPRKSRSRSGRTRRRRGSSAAQNKDAPKSPSTISVNATESVEDGEQVAHRIDTVLRTPSEVRKAIRTKNKGRDMIINTTAGDECRIAVLHGGRLEELFIERTASASHVGSIYKGVITNVEPSIQAAFIDFGLKKNGFLHISDVQPQYFPNHNGEHESVGQKIPRHQRPPIQNCFRRGQEVIVQIIKEGVGTKGPTLTTYLSIPGRYLVMMPGMSRHGVSRKIEDDEARRTMRDMLNELTLPPDMGFIARTAGLGQNKRDLQRDLNYLQRLWKTVVERVMAMKAPAELYRESDLVTRTIRDVYSADFRRIMTDSADTATKVREFLQIAMPRTKVRLELYEGHEPLFHCLGIEDEIDRINQRHVPLPSGGSLVIDSTEALVAIDVNSGRSRAIKDAEESAFRLNVEAAEEIARQLRLRDLGGLIVCDFVDMRLDRNKRNVERALRNALKEHKERARILRISAFGLIEITRQRQGPSIRRNIYADCPYCRGGGVVKTPDSVVLDVMRSIQLAAHKPAVKTIRVSVSDAVAYLILNDKRSALYKIEEETDKRIQIRGEASFTSDQVEYAFLDEQANPARISLTEGSRA